MSNPQIKEAQKHLPEKLKPFVVTMFGNAPADDLKMIGAELMANTAKRHMALAEKRRPGEVKIEIYTPPLVKDDFSVGHTVINIVMDDMPFIIDSVTARIVGNYKLIHMLVHPILHVTRGKGGKLSGIAAKPGKDTHPESHMHIQLQGTLPEESCKRLQEDLATVLRDVKYATGDWQKVRTKVQACREQLAAAKTGAPKEDLQECLSFLDYIYNDNFTLLGYREYKFSGDKDKMKRAAVRGSGLGLLHGDITPDFINMGIKNVIAPRKKSDPPVTVTKISRPSTVHRPVPIDAISVLQFDDKGNVTGEGLIIGLFTSVTYSRSIQDVPLLRHKAEEVMSLSSFRPGSHNYKALRHVLEKYPRDELFQMRVEDIYTTALSILRLQKRQRIALYIRPDTYGGHISCLVYVPRDRYDTRIRLTFEHILEEELGGKCTNFYTTLDDSPLARVMFSIETGASTPTKIDARRIESRLQEAGKEWAERLAGALLEELDDEERITALVRKYGNAFPALYQEKYLPKQATYDVGKCEEALDTRLVAFDLYCDKECSERQLRLKIYNPEMPVTLSDVLPMLENMGLSVLSELPFQVRPFGSPVPVWIHDFMMSAHSADIDIDKIKKAFEETLHRVWYGEAESDSLNALVVAGDMNWRDVMVLRAYVRYMRQMRYPLGTRYIEKAMTSHPHIAGKIAGLFKALHDPAEQKTAAARAKKITADIEKALDRVSSLDEDRIIRTLVNLVQETLRTNFFQKDKNGEPKTYLSFKLASGNIKGLPDPKPFREIFVYSRRTEGVHLRGDRIARGGIRWSDRHEDFRTEVLGLMKAQQVKNAIIVPMGAKGGFIVKNPPAEGGRKAFLEEGIECYKIFIRGLLDITDNRKGRKVVPPKDVVRLDDDDPYLVVAADKGTASFSDIANSLSVAYGFWLDDAFASGGSAGYDHKKMGITARGAWESVKRHFRELNHDTQSKPFDVIGIGDMGGDVFGNGMLLSKHICMVGAFNHLHIFCDPDPDPESSFKERKRLFDGVCGWDEYDVKKLSAGGRIYQRSDKSLKLTPEIRQRFGIDGDTATPAELIQAMLRAHTDLLWFGGIGTYIKSSHETHADAGDKGNDPLRIDATELRAKVIGEGANLAMTQRARIEFAMRGGKLNTDFIDNSAGVDSSDHEVNIKILMTGVMNEKDNDMTRAKRDKLLESMTEEVGALVLRDNYQQAQGLSLMEMQAAEHLSVHAQFIRDLEKHGLLKRKLEFLPDEEALAERISAGKGLTRPELAIIQAYSKIVYATDLLDSDIPDQEVLQDYWLIDYFPAPLRKKYREEILGHRLRREIFVTTMANSLVNRVGPTFVKTLMDRTGASCADVTRAYIVARESFNVRPLWNDIEKLDNKAPAAAQLRAMRDIIHMLERETSWFLTRLGREPDIARDIAKFRDGIEQLHQGIDGVITHNMAHDVTQRVNAHVADGLPEKLARRIALIPIIGSGSDIVRISLESGADIMAAAGIYFEAGEYFHIDWLRRQAQFMPANDRWASEARDSLIEHLYGCQAGLTARILKDVKGKAAAKKPSDIVGTWLERHAQQAAQLEPFLAEIGRAAHVDLPMLMIAEQRLRGLYGG